MRAPWILAACLVAGLVGAELRAQAQDPADDVRPPPPQQQKKAAQPAQPALRPDPDATRWDHWCTKVEPGGFTDVARKAGAEGWEMVSLVSFETAKATVGAYPFNVDVNFVMCFKRPLRRA